MVNEKSWLIVCELVTVVCHGGVLCLAERLRWLF